MLGKPGSGIGQSGRSESGRLHPVVYQALKMAASERDCRLIATRHEVFRQGERTTLVKWPVLGPGGEVAAYVGWGHRVLIWRRA